MQKQSVSLIPVLILLLFGHKNGAPVLNQNWRFISYDQLSRKNRCCEYNKQYI